MPPKTVAARIEARIHVIRGERVMLDADLAALYGVETRIVNRAVSRNRSRFPADFMFHLTAQETDNLKSQFGMSSFGHGGRRHLPFAFTEQGVAMLSSVLNSERAIATNILIMRTFVQLRQALSETVRLGHRVDEIEKRVDEHGAVIDEIVGVLQALEEPAREKQREIGFRPKT